MQIVLKTYSRIEYLGATAFIYWTYYKEFYDFLLDVSADDKKKKLYKKAAHITIRTQNRHLRQITEYAAFQVNRLKGEQFQFKTNE